MSQNATVNVDIKLGVNKFHVDEGHPGDDANLLI